MGAKRIRQGLVGALLFVAGVVATAALAGPVGPAMAYGPNFTCTIAANPSTVPLGGNFDVTMNCSSTVAAGDTFTIVLHSAGTVLGTITINGDGTGSASFTDPPADGTGNHPLTATDPSGYSVSTSITVFQPGATSPGTGSSSTTTVAGAPTTHTSTGAGTPAAHTTSGLAFTGTDAAATAAAGAAAIGAGGAFVLLARRRRAAGTSPNG